MRTLLYGVWVWMLLASACYSQEKASAARKWENISDPTVKVLTKEGVKFDWPGNTAGVTVDPASGDVYMILAGQGIWKSKDAGETFARVDEGKIGGRCETAFALNFDPAGKRLACFMLDGKCAWTGDEGQTWQPFADVGRNWDFAAVDWTAGPIQNIFAGLHESGGQVMRSSDGGKSWQKLFQDPEFDKSGGLGIFDAKTLVYTQKGKGIQRSTDGGNTWTKVAEHEPIGRVMQVHQGIAYWLDKKGLLTSKDRGVTWTVQGKPVDATIGPFLDPRDPRRMAVGGIKGIWRTNDGGESWEQIAGLPDGFDLPKAGWYTNIAWDPTSDIFYASRMSKPTFRLRVAKSK